MNFISKAMCLVMNMEKMLGPAWRWALSDELTLAEGGRT